MRTKKANLIIFIFTFMFLLIPSYANASVKAPKKECHAYVVMDAGSGAVLFGQDQDKKIYPASTTKLMTAIVCIENGDVNSKIKTKYDVVYGTTPGTYCLGIGANVTYTFKDLLSFSLVSSAADATDSLAVAVFGSKEACVEAMNKKCQELGLTHTHFDNPVGSDLGAGYTENYTTATEMALITRYAMSIPLIRKTVRKSSYSASNGLTSNTTNMFLRGTMWYDEDKYQIIGSKSGTTDAAGHVFIATAKDKSGHEVICAFFGNVSKESTFVSIRRLLDYTFKQYKKGKLTLTPSNYDVRCSDSLGAAFLKYGYLNVYPGEKDGKFHWARAITRSEFGKMMGGVNNLSDRAVLSAFVNGNKNGKLTAARLASLIQELYPTHLSSDEIDETLADCSHTDNLTDEEKEAFAVFIREGLNPDDSCKNASQIINRKQAVLFTAAFTDYQMQYETTHFVRTAIALQTDASTSTQSVCPGISMVNNDWLNKFATFHNEKEAERAQKAAERAAKKAAEEAEKAAQEAATATEATTQAPADATTASDGSTATTATDPSAATTAADGSMATTAAAPADATTAADGSAATTAATDTATTAAAQATTQAAQ